MSDKPCGLRMTEEDLRTHLDILRITENTLQDALETFEDDPASVNYVMSKVNAVKRILDAAARDLSCTHDYLIDEMRKKNMKIRLATV